MNKKLNNGFTLVELLAVIVILAIILVIAVPKVMNVIEDAKKATLESTAKMIAGQAEKQKIQNTVLGKTNEITCESVTKINDVDYDTCEVIFENNVAYVTIAGKGKFEGLYVCNGTKINALAKEEMCEIPTAAERIIDLLAQEEITNNGLREITVNLSTSTSMDDLSETTNKEIRYVGANPNNKVYFNCAETDGTNAYGSKNYNYEDNCEIWRIIGVFDVQSAMGSKKEKRIKIIKDEPIMSTIWDDSGSEFNSWAINQWGETTSLDGSTVFQGATLMRKLNVGYNGNESYYNSLSSIAKEQTTQNALWYTNSIEIDRNNHISSYQLYVNERTGTRVTTATAVKYTYEWVGKVGLIYPSDLTFAAQNCTDIYSQSCYENNWLSKDYGYWTLFALDGSGVRAVLAGSGVGFDVCYTNYNVLPVLYLDSDIEIIGGNGGTEPFKLK